MKTSSIFSLILAVFFLNNHLSADISYCFFESSDLFAALSLSDVENRQEEYFIIEVFPERRIGEASHLIGIYFFINGDQGSSLEGEKIQKKLYGDNDSYEALGISYPAVEIEIISSRDWEVVGGLLNSFFKLKSNFEMPPSLTEDLSWRLTYFDGGNRYFGELIRPALISKSLWEDFDNIEFDQAEFQRRFYLKMILDYISIISHRDVVPLMPRLM